LNAEAKATSPALAFRERLQKIDVKAVRNSRREFKTLIDAESEKLGALIRKIDIKVEQ